MLPETRPLGPNGPPVTPVAMGCWPIAGMTSLRVREPDSLATLHAALDRGITFFDTAYCYGANGESERLLGQALRGRRKSVLVATKGGVHWDVRGNRQQDARPETLIRQCEESLRRLGTDYVDLLYLHAPDPQIPVAESAGALRQLYEQGKTRAIGVSNVSVAQLEAFHRVCPVAAVQSPFNMLQRQIEDDLVPWCHARSVAVVVYWPLMKGLLAGRLGRDHRFEPQDGRVKYPMFQGQEWQRNQDFVDCLRQLAHRLGRTVAQVVVNWTIHRPGITVALCGAKRPYQIEETAEAMGWQLDHEALAWIDRALAERGTAQTRQAI